jgi:hypothetical protein
MAVELIKRTITKRALVHPKRGKTMPAKLPVLPIGKTIKK